jgi:hypothetical protein
MMETGMASAQKVGSSKPIRGRKKAPAPVTEGTLMSAEELVGLGAEPAPVSVEPVAAEHPIAIEETTTTEAAPVAVAALTQEGTQDMNDTIETARSFTEESKNRIQTMIADMNDKAKAAMEKSTKIAEDMSEIAKGNMEAVVESSRIAAKGVEAFGQDAAEYSRKHFEKATTVFKSFASVKSPAEFLQLQSELFTSAFDNLASETAKNSEAMLKLAGDIAQPISSRVAVVTEKVKSFAA